ncbi:AmmeMemoRadiSam system protein B [Gaoshiqia sp. Z1-71]|uniref:AmmeMemoRadiSam system protein B n=1 Tax=Gaoshiqia hydrogeniformans TaxID=3290090 RepID=UPI003BF7DED9
MRPSIREPVFAGTFYPKSKTALTQLIQHAFETGKNQIQFELAKNQLIGGIVPHAGYVFSAYHAVYFYALLRQSRQQMDTVVIVNPNHTGYGSGQFNCSLSGFWETPLGKAEIDREFTEALGIPVNESAHALEHSGEVQLPLLQFFLPKPFRVVMITMNSQTVESAGLLAKRIHQAQKKTGRKIVLIASSDFSHYETPETGYEKDQHVIDRILKLDTAGIFQAVKTYQVSACGYGPVMTLVAYARLAAPQPEIRVLQRGNSGEVRPADKVVDYVSLVCYQ